MGFPWRVRCTGGGWPTVLDAQWLVDGADSPRCRWTRTWPEPIHHYRGKQRFRYE